jgi:SAM-dependent methyltransferase
MPSINDNRSSWGGSYGWPQQGDEWSASWGNVETQWNATLLPRIHHFIPAGRVLEIAPGYGRWSRFLIERSEQYIGVDLNTNCVEACQRRFLNAKHATFFANDGKSLGMVEDNSVEFVFSFDSLVHVELDVIESYLHELSRKLSPNGVAFIHHSNLGASSAAALNRLRVFQTLSSRIPIAKSAFRQLGLIDWDHWRAPSVTAQKVAHVSKTAGISCIGQEVINWANWRMTDCISVLTRPGSRWDRPNVVVLNPYFVPEAASAKALSKVYGFSHLESHESPRQESLKGDARSL